MKDKIKQLITVIIFCTQIVFCVLKWGGVIDWSWLWVLSPGWISIALLMLFFIGFFLGWLIWKLTKKR